MADDALIRQIKDANDIVAVVGAHVALKPAGGTFKGLCPFHNDNHPSFDVDPRRQRYRCWSCGKYGDVFSFVQEHERVGFREAVELLARRAGISLENHDASPQAKSRALMLDVVRWAAGQFQECLLDDPQADSARRYLGGRRLTGETVRRFGLGYAPLAGDWLVGKAQAAQVTLDVLEQVGLVGKRQEGNGYYDRFRDRVLFPIRNPGGQTVGFGGRVLPGSPLESRAPKYYNSADTPLFKKGELLYGLDQARQAGAAAGYLAVVEGYTDVLMAHQTGVPQVVATMGTALNAVHVRKLRSFAPRVVLVFDADAGGDTGADRALQIFAGQDVDLAIATLPQGLDPCDLLVRDGPEAFREVLNRAVDALEFKLNQTLALEGASVEGRRRTMDAVLGIMALAPELSGQAGAVKRDLMLTRIGQRLSLNEGLVRGRLEELRADRPRADRSAPRPGQEEALVRRAKADPLERQLIEVLLAEPGLISQAAAEVRPEEFQHPGLRRLLEELYRTQTAGETFALDRLRMRLDNPELAEHVLRLQDIGRMVADRAGWLTKLLESFRQRRTAPARQEMTLRLRDVGDHEQAVELLRKVQAQTDGLKKP